MLSEEYLKEVINSPANELTIALATELLSLRGHAVKQLASAGEEVFKLRAELTALKGDQMPVSGETGDQCSPEVYEKGVSACLVDIPKDTAEIICRGISAASGCAVDWHYVGGRVHIKAMQFTTTQKPVVLLQRYSIEVGVNADPNGEWVAFDEVKEAIRLVGFAVEGAE
ncbi:Uncharacterised protein [Yersinia aldovae]|uniref:hypothetical protein n=1 Tax=Yersinia aldovae TaxID=29483 RepID=UPI0005E7AD3D|nr:hypothetical protein [Yersinia aldovae]CNJ04098.1 Uncharacterised protein [Yersinia aldovae]